MSVHVYFMNKKVTAVSNLSDKDKFGFCVKSLIWWKITFELLPAKFKHWEKRKREFQSKSPWKLYTWSEKPKRFQSGPQTTTCFSIMGFSFQLSWIYFWNVLNSYLLFESFFEGKELHYDVEIKMERVTLWLKLKLQYSGHLMWRADSLGKTLMLGKIEGRRGMSQQRMRWFDGITDSMDTLDSSPPGFSVHGVFQARILERAAISFSRAMDMSFSKRWWWTEKPGVLQSMGLQRVGHNWVTEQ